MGQDQGRNSKERLGERIRPDGGAVLLTVECQQGVVGPDSALPELAAAPARREPCGTSHDSSPPRTRSTSR